MDQRIKLREAYRNMRSEGRWPKPQPASKPSGTFQHFDTEEKRQLHLDQVAWAQKNGAPF